MLVIARNGRKIIREIKKFSIFNKSLKKNEQCREGEENGYA